MRRQSTDWRRPFRTAIRQSTGANFAYRRLPEVLAEHAGSIKVLHTLRPFAVAMAGENEFDPFKD
jgi:hypothetical protein